MYDPLAPQNPNGIAGKPMETTADANGNVYESLQAANAVPAPKEKPNLQDEIEHLHKETPIPRLRTYESDIADAIRNEESSIIKIAVAEKKREQTMEPLKPEPSKVNFLMLGLSILLVLAGLATLGTFVYVMIKQAGTRPVETATETKVAATETSREISVKPADNIIDALKNAQASLTPEDGPLASLVFLQSTTTVGAKGTPMSAETFMGRLSSGAPSWLVRSFEQNFIVGFYLRGSENQPFIILKTSSYENAFSGMLTWENTIAGDLKRILPQYTETTVIRPAVATTTKKTGTTTPAAATTTIVASIPYADHFEDIVVRNKNVRALKDMSGNIILMYSFPDKETLIITSSDAAIKEIFSRLTTLQFVR